MGLIRVASGQAMTFPPGSQHQAHLIVYSVDDLDHTCDVELLFDGSVQQAWTGVFIPGTQVQLDSDLITMPTMEGKVIQVEARITEGTWSQTFPCGTITIETLVVRPIAPSIQLYDFYWREDGTGYPTEFIAGIRPGVLIINIDNYSQYTDNWDWAPVDYVIEYIGPFTTGINAYGLCDPYGQTWSGQASAGSMFGGALYHLYTCCNPGTWPQQIKVTLYHPDTGQSLGSYTFTPEAAMREPSPNNIAVVDNPSACTCDEETTFVYNDDLLECIGGVYTVVFEGLGLGSCSYWENNGELKCGNDAMMYRCVPQYGGNRWTPQGYAC